ncbi:DUF2812 domain-containing protein [Thalassobacillus hwangdonensis]|uniref:DUF2812 domain-containing protein n=1 Tax=Thalassobacillus hwangdonensis TaxID=546108 RepID=A0ABW3KV48_9BACI
MKKRTKYIMNNGLAFSENSDMEKLGALAKEGWIFERISSFGFTYKLKRGKPQQVQYSIDYQKNPDEEYFSYFEEAGWTHIDSSVDYIHIFQGAEDAIPLYSDKETMKQKYSSAKKMSGLLAFPALLVLLALFFIRFLSVNGTLPAIAGDISVGLMMIVFIVLVFSGMPYAAYLWRLFKMK